mmetsp:Transcript_65131/g.136444  ORF Transcript_65131/g.136444 Transcript_65131/m.136444 type:complete len:271 (-) Transcript_65131:342-1154(-)
MPLAFATSSFCASKALFRAAFSFWSSLAFSAADFASLRASASDIFIEASSFSRSASCFPAVACPSDADLRVAISVLRASFSLAKCFALVALAESFSCREAASFISSSTFVCRAFALASASEATALAATTAAADFSAIAATDCSSDWRFLRFASSSAAFFFASSAICFADASEFLDSSRAFAIVSASFFIDANLASRACDLPSASLALFFAISWLSESSIFSASSAFLILLSSSWALSRSCSATLLAFEAPLLNIRMRSADSSAFAFQCAA